MRIWLVFAVSVFAFSGAVLAQAYKGSPWYSADRCTGEDADAASAAADRFEDWAALYRAFRQYAKCDDGSIAEGYSDGVAQLLVHHWQTLPEFAKLARTDRQFDRFVFFHIDETGNMDDGQAVIANARHRCPTGLKALCRRLEKAEKTPREKPL